ncbi:MAG: hypothetical protein HXX16_11315 [Bacteroidales bacterium]|nr:hypothetical protein [Bacteroidales bacterium]
MMKDFDVTYVGLLDILGFKELALRNNHQELIKIYDLFDKVVKRGLTLFKESFQNDEFKPRVDSIKINSLTISDSLILWTENTKFHHFINLVVTIRAILSEAMRCGIPLRGTIVVGPISVREEKLNSNTENIKLTCFGKSIVDAYTLSEKQNWSGCIITKECIERYQMSFEELKLRPSKYTNDQIDKSLSLSSLENKKLLRKYLVPLKDGKLAEEYVINWVNELNPKMEELSIRNSFVKYNKSVDDWRVEMKIRNTIAFANDCT